MHFQNEAARPPPIVMCECEVLARSLSKLVKDLTDWDVVHFIVAEIDNESTVPFRFQYFQFELTKDGSSSLKLQSSQFQ